MTPGGADPPGEQSLVGRFLGPEAAAGGMHALLGLTSSNSAEEQIIGALERALTRVDGHPQGRTPESDEVRLALHAAAAQLLSQAAARRRALGPQASAPKRSASTATRARMLEQDALLTLARYGGWNRRSLRRLTMLAVARGARPADLVGVLEHLAGRRRNPGGALRRPGLGPTLAAPSAERPISAEPVATAFPTPGPDDRPSRLPVVIGGVATLLALVIATALVIVAFTTVAPPPEPTNEAQTPGRKPIDPEALPMAGGEELFPWQGEKPEKAAAEDAEPAASSFDRLSDALAALDSAVDGLAIDPAAAVRVFDGAFAGVGGQWCSLTLAQQRAAQHDVVEFVYRAVQRPELTAPVVNAIARAGDAVLAHDTAAAEEAIWPAAWSVGVLARLAHERDISASASRLIEARLRECIGSTAPAAGGFDQGAAAALWGLLPSMITDAPGDTPDTRESRWGRWIDAVHAGPGGGQGGVLAALEWVVLSPSEPTDAEPVRVAIESLTLALDWGDSSPARPWLIRMFADQRVSTPDLHALTTTLARRSRAPGIDVTMALPVRADADAREQMRERYAAAWDIETSGPTLDDLAADWAKAAAEADQSARDDQTLAERLASAASFSRLSHAAQLRREGRLDEAGILIDEYDLPIEQELAAWGQRRQADRLDTSPGMAQWSLEYLSAQRDLSLRLRLLGDAAARTLTHPTDAEVLVTESVRGSPAQVRAAARAALLGQRPSAVLTLAMLEVAPRVPRTEQNAELVAALTATMPLTTEDPDWRLRTRRLLVQTALEQLAAEGDQGLLDKLAAVLGESYAARAAGAAAAGGALPAVPPDQAAAMLRAQCERQARQGGLGPEGLEIEGVLARHTARASLAEGPVQSFAAEQLAAFELSCIAAASERLESAAEVRALAARALGARRAARDIIEQITVVERSFLELWALRLGQEAPWD